MGKNPKASKGNKKSKNWTKLLKTKKLTKYLSIVNFQEKRVDVEPILKNGFLIPHPKNVKHLCTEDVRGIKIISSRRKSVPFRVTAKLKMIVCFHALLFGVNLARASSRVLS